MNLAKRYARKETRDLIVVLEHAENYNPEALAAAKAELGYRELAPELIQQLAVEVNRDRIIKQLNALDPLNGELKVPRSHFLSEQEIRSMLEEEFQLLLERKKGFRFDVWKYAIGG